MRDCKDRGSQESPTLERKQMSVMLQVEEGEGGGEEEEESSGVGHHMDFERSEFLR